MTPYEYPENFELVIPSTSVRGRVYMPDIATKEDALVIAKQLRMMAKVFIMRSNHLPEEREARVVTCICTHHERDHCVLTPQGMGCKQCATCPYFSPTEQ